MKKFLNPFVYYSGGVTLTVGLIGMALMVAVAAVTGQTFRGIFSFGVGELSCWRLAGQLLAGWILFSALLYAAARTFSPSQIRLIDIAGNQALAKLTGLPLLLVDFVYPSAQLLRDAELVQQMSLSEIQSQLPAAGMLVTGVLAIVVLVWFFAWSYQGFSIAANLRGGKAVGIYIGCYVLAEALVSLCTAMLR